LSISTAGHFWECSGSASFRPQNCSFTCGHLHPCLIHVHGSLGRAHPSSQPNGISSGSATFAGFTIVTDRPTDHATPFAAVRCGLIISCSRRCVYDISHFAAIRTQKNITPVRRHLRFSELLRRRIHFSGQHFPVTRLFSGIGQRRAVSGHPRRRGIGRSVAATWGTRPDHTRGIVNSCV